MRREVVESKWQMEREGIELRIDEGNGGQKVFFPLFFVYSLRWKNNNSLEHKCLVPLRVTERGKQRGGWADSDGEEALSRREDLGGDFPPTSSHCA